MNVTNKNSSVAIPKIHRDEFDLSLRKDPFLYAAKTGRNKLEEQFEALALSLTMDYCKDDQLFIDRPCPLCANHKTEELFVKYGIPVVRCEVCGFMYANPIIDSRKVPFDIMETGEMSRAHLTMLKQDMYRECARKRFTFELQQLFQHAEYIPRSYLEIGCSIGTGLEVAEAFGLDSVGIEANNEAAQEACSRGHRVIIDRFKPECFCDRKFDIVACMDVLEHVEDPIAFLRAMRSVVSDTGYALIQVPNAGALISLVEGKKNQIFNGLIHLNYFDSGSLENAVQKAGFKSVALFTVLSELGKVRHYPVEALTSTLKTYHPEYISHFRLHQDWINDNGFGYKVIGIFKT